jgi:peptidoglycan/xylan/chitin deacetylase (PgdA/CDA1 family)
MFSGPERTDRLIEQLEKVNVSQVVFFCVTGKLPYHDGHARLERYAEAGHLIANHSHSHNRPGDIGAASYIADIKQAHDSLKRYATFTPWYRYPMLDEGKTIPVRDSIREALSSLGYINSYVTVDTWDWYIDSNCRDAARNGQKIDTVALGRIYVETLWEAIQFYDNMAIEVLGYSPKHVLLLHENDLAALFIDDLVNLLRKRGWEIISPAEAYGDSIANRIPDVLYNNQGRVAAIAVEQGYDGPLRHVSERAEYLDSLFQANRVFHER